MAYFLTISGQQKGPYEEGEIRRLIGDGAVALDDLVWVAERNRWLQIKFYPQVASFFEEVARSHKDETSDGFYINVDGKTSGPYDNDTILKEIENGRIQANHFIWEPSQNKWLLLKDHSKYASIVYEHQMSVEVEPKKQKYYIGKDGARFGPFSDIEIEEKIRNGEYSDSHFFWDISAKKWVPLKEVEILSAVFEEIAEAEPEEPPPPSQTAIIAPEIEVTPVPATASRADRVREILEAAQTTPQETVTEDTEEIPIPTRTAIETPAASVQTTQPTTEPGTIINISGTGPPIEIPSDGEGEKQDSRIIMGTSTLIEDRPIDVEETITVAKEQRKYVEYDAVDDEPIEVTKIAWYKRLGSGLVDLALPALSYFVAALVMTLIGRNPFLESPEQALNQQIFYGSIAGCVIVYFLFRDTIRASGFGKNIMGYQIVKPPTYTRPANPIICFIRNLFAIIPIINIIDLIIMLTDSQGRRLIDKILKTSAVEKIEIEYIRDKQGTF